ncbi:cobalamin B12-binding domain-containing protein [Salinactinospora qingdaonensis]|uniref:Cobalamin B12-binding domain-containing protein n=1 Tax=Salinactinospora qingdaonensis TaxID=702744 RepID=A0ABP7GER0_9ACTN
MSSASETRAVSSLLHHLERADDVGAVAFSRTLVAEGRDTESLLLDVIAPAHVKIGRLWQDNDWSVAQEHAATCTSERLLSALVPASPAYRTAAKRGSVLVACVEGEWHGLPARLLADVLRLRGWEVTFLGANVPEGALTNYAQGSDYDAVALSCSLPLRLPKAGAMIEACHSIDLPVIAGGAGFGPDSRWARPLGAEGWATSGRGAATALESLGTAHATPAPAPHSRDEYVNLLQRREDAIRIGLHRLTEHHHLSLTTGRLNRDHMVEILSHLFDSLAVSLYVGETTLFMRFLHWVRAMLAARHVPFATVLEAMTAYATLLYDYPATVATLRQARAELTE